LPRQCLAPHFQLSGAPSLEQLSSKFSRACDRRRIADGEQMLYKSLDNRDAIIEFPAQRILEDFIDLRKPARISVDSQRGHEDQVALRLMGRNLAQQSSMVERKRWRSLPDRQSSEDREGTGIVGILRFACRSQSSCV
jgi:hypothetical protein